MSNKYTKEDILNFLKEQYITEIATSANNKPAASIMLYAVDDEFNFYFATHIESYKSKNLQTNPLVGLAIWKPRKMLVQVDAKVEIVDSEEEKLKVLDRLAESASKEADFWPPVFRIKGGDYIIFKAKPYWLRALDLEVNTVRQEDIPFTEIKF